MFDAESDYVVEEYVRPNKTRIPLINDERADILGNFDDSKRKEIESGKVANNSDDFEENPFEDNEDDDDNDDDDEDDNDIAASDNVEKEESETNGPATSQTDKTRKGKKKKENDTEESNTPNVSKDSTNPLSDAQITALLRGTTKKDRFVLYVTNLNYDTSKSKLEEFFSTAGAVRSVRVPKTRKNAFAFVEMGDLEGFKRALTLHHKSLDSYKIKIQVSEGGKKKSANKKNILKQKNRKLAEMRNEVKQFTKSGKGYSKTIKKEIKQKQIQQARRLERKKSIKKK